VYRVDEVEDLLSHNTRLSRTCVRW